MTRNTNTGKVFEDITLPVLKNAGYTYKTQVNIGNKPNGKKHIIDCVIQSGDRQILISKKWQQTSGSAEDKIPFEVIILAHACRNLNYDKAYLVLGGTDQDKELHTKGWTLRRWYLSGGLDPWIRHQNQVEIISFDAFIAKINRREL